MFLFNANTAFLFIYILFSTGEAVKNKWKTIRDGYTKYKKQFKGTTGGKNNNYIWASQLAFLDDFNGPRAHCSNVVAIEFTPPRNDTPPMDSDHSQDFISSFKPSPPSQDPPPESSPNVTTSSTPRAHTVSCSNTVRPLRNSKNDDDVEKVIRFFNPKKGKEHDGIDHLFLSYADTFKKFPPREQALIKLELARLFSNTELKLLNNDSNNSQSRDTLTSSPAYWSIISVDNRTSQEMTSTRPHRLNQ